MRLTIGQVFPEWDGRALNVSWKAVMTVMDGLTDASPAVHDPWGLSLWSPCAAGGVQGRVGGRTAGGGARDRVAEARAGVKWLENEF